MNTLDNIAAIQNLDPSNVLGSISMFSNQCTQAWNDAKSVQFPSEYKQIHNIVVCGMGGSRFTPRTIKELYWNNIAVPYEIVDSYILPAYVNENTLVILSSYSGTTEEVISCGQEALKRHAKITGMAKGGPIIDFLKTYNFPYYQFNPKNNPCSQPRMGGGYLLMSHLAFLVSLGFLSVTDYEVTDAIAWSKSVGAQYKPDISTDNNLAKQLAMYLKDKHPFLIASEFLRGYVNGFANQINENAKMISDFRYIPELNHHLMEGLTRPETLHQNGVFVFLNSNLYSAPIQKRFQVTKEVVQKQHIQIKDIYFLGKDKLSQILEGFMLSGYVTFYMAMLYDTDPVAIPWVDYFKTKLAK